MDDIDKLVTGVFLNLAIMTTVGFIPIELAIVSGSFILYSSYVLWAES